VAGNTAVTVLSGGDVGIGTTDPEGLLEVYGSANDKFQLWSAGFADIYRGGRRLRLTPGVAAGSTAVIGSSTGLSLGGSGINNSDLTVSTNGNVGIGTTNPLADLEVNADSGESRIRVVSTGNNSAMISFVNGLSTKGYIGYVDSDKAFKIVAGPNSTLDHITISQNGNVGIGTTAPGTKFMVSESVLGAGAEAVFFNSYVSADEVQRNSLRLASADLSRYWELATFQTGAVTTVTDFAIRKGIDGPSVSEKLRITNAGNVGIGTATPNAKLEVSGSNGDDFGLLRINATGLNSNHSNGISLFSESTGYTNTLTSNIGAPTFALDGGDIADADFQGYLGAVRSAQGGVLVLGISD